MANIKSIVDDALYRKPKLDPGYCRVHAIAAFENLWNSHPWRFRLTRGQINAVGGYSTGTITALTQALKAVTGTTTVWGPEFTFRHLRPSNNSGSGDIRDYLITARGSDTTLTIEDPYEGATITSASYEIYKKWYTLPPDFSTLAIAKDTGTARIVRHLSRIEFENSELSPSSGGPYWIVDAATTRLPLWNTGTVTMTENSATVTGASSPAFLAARDEGHRFRVRGMTRYGDFRINSVNSITELTLDREWKGSTKSGLAYDIDPAGEPLVEIYPRPDANTALSMWYYRNLPPLAIDTETPLALPLEFHDAWLYGTLARLGIVEQGEYMDKLSPLMTRQGLVTHERTRSSPYGGAGGVERSLLPSDYPAHYHR